MNPIALWLFAGFLSTGKVDLIWEKGTTGTPSVGQGVETVFAQICADVLGVRYEDVTVRYGDTDALPDSVEGILAARIDRLRPTSRAGGPRRIAT